MVKPVGYDPHTTLQIKIRMQGYKVFFITGVLAISLSAFSRTSLSIKRSLLDRHAGVACPEDMDYLSTHP